MRAARYKAIRRVLRSECALAAGQRVQPSKKGIAQGIFDRCKHGVIVVGTVKRLNRMGYPVVIWDDRRTEASYHPSFIEPIDHGSPEDIRE